MLNLASETAASWAPQAEAQLDVLLLDHAHCEKKAASTALNMMFRYADDQELVATLSPIAREELQHFELMLGILRERGLEFKRLEPSLYAAKLYKAVRRAEPQRLLDTLLVCSLIEARSCERMKILSESLSDAKLAGFYKSLLASEARHHHVYVDMALGRYERQQVFDRLEELAAHEANVLGVDEPALRMHS